MLFSGFHCLTQAKRHLSALYMGIAEDCHETEKKVSGKRMVQGGDGGDTSIQRGAVFKQRPKHNKRLCLFRALSLVERGWRRWLRRKSRRRRPTNCPGAVPAGREEGKQPGIRPNAPFPSRPGGIRSGKPLRLRKRRLCSRASAVPHGGGRERSLSRCLGLTPTA
jgi:hypothetical protein